MLKYLKAPHCRRFFLFAWISLTLVACGNQGAAERAPLLEIQGRTMGTTYSVKLLPADTQIQAEVLQAEIDQHLRAISQSMSTYIKDSELSRLNQARPGQWQPMSSMFLQVLTAARAVHQLSHGAFDPTIGPLVNLWGFGPDMGQVFPSAEAVEQARAQLGVDRLEVDAQQGRIRKTQSLYLDFSAIAKGYAVDVVAGLLAARGIENYLVEIGGELRSSGHNAERLPWRIAVEKPVAGGRQVHGVVNVSGLGMATSGDYRNFFEKDGRRYSHTIDPRTGYPVTHALVSVTVLAEEAMAADAWATAFMVMGAEAGYELAHREDMAVWFIEQKDQKLVDKLTPKMQSYRVH